MRNAVAARIQKAAEDNPFLFVIAGDAGLGVWDRFQEKHPNQFLNPGVNEQCDIGLAAGMALLGHRMVYYNIAPFVLMRPYEQVRNDICYQDLPVILVGTGVGITYAPAGMTHYAVEDIALARTLPGLDIYSPADPVEAVACFDYALRHDRPAYIRIAKSGEPVLHSSPELDICRPQIIRTGGDLLLFTHGSIADQLDILAETLAGRGLRPTIATVPMLTSGQGIRELVDAHRHVFTFEEHFIDGGLGTILMEYCNHEAIDRRIQRIGIPCEYIHAIGDCAYLRRHYRIDGLHAALQILSWMEEK